MNTFDLVLIVLLGLGGLSGFQKGLITGLSRFAGKIASIAIAVVFHKQFLAEIDPLFNLREKIQPQIAGLLSKAVDAQAGGGGQFGNTEAIIQPLILEATIALTDYALKIIAFIVLFLLASIILNLIITLVITPLARTLGFVNRGGGFAFGILSTFLVLSLLIGMAAPLLTAANTGSVSIANSLLLPWFISGYYFVISIVSVFAGDILSNPLEAFPFLKGTEI